MHLVVLYYLTCMALVVTAKYHAISNYSGTPPPIGNRAPLTFEKGDVIDVLNDDGDFFEVSSLLFL